MAQAQLTIDLGALVRNWQALSALAPGAEAAAVVKADAYGLGLERVAPALVAAGCRSFFVASAEEGARLRPLAGEVAAIYVLCGYLPADQPLLRAHDLWPVLGTTAQITTFISDLPGHPCAIHVDTGMNRFGLKSSSLLAVGLQTSRLDLRLVISHLACSDESWHMMNGDQLAEFQAMTRSLDGIPRSLANTGGVLLGTPYHFDMVRPGIGIYGGLPFKDAEPVVHLSLPVLQVSDLLPGESVGYGAAFVARRASRIATLAAGYGDGLHRALGDRGFLFAGHIPCPVAGRVSMDMVSVDVTELDTVPDRFEVLGRYQSVDGLAAAAGTIGYEILTALGSRYSRTYVNPPASPAQPT